MIDIGFIGLGTMGRPMARHLLAAGHRVFLHDVAPIAPELKSGGGIACQSGKEVAEEADAIIIMVPDTPHVEAVLFGEDGSRPRILLRGSPRSARIISTRRYPAARSGPRPRASPSWSADPSAPSIP
jgi:lactate dehydrogenase-like 2-hydroxyacid dehydrogenase